MKEQILFSEKQKFNQWWLWLLLTGTAVVSGYFTTKDIQPGDTLKKVFFSYAANGAVIGILVLFFLIIRLETLIKEDGIYVRFFPVHIRFKHFHWEDLSQIYVRKYAPLAEFGGWGIRWNGFSGAKKAYNVKGKEGLQLEFKNGKKLLVGTQKPKELEQVLHGMNRYVLPSG